MAKSARQRAFELEFRECIEKFTPRLVSALRKTVKTKVPRTVKVLLFVIQSDWRDFPVYSFAMDGEAPNEVYFKSPFYGPVLPKAGELIPEGAIDQDAYEDKGVATFETGARVMAEWFGECWQTAGGSKFPIRACIHHHDRSQYYDLRRQRWVHEEDVWFEEEEEE